MRRSTPETALRVHVDVPQDLINQVANGLIDIAVMYAPPHRPGLRIDLLLDEELVMVTTSPENDAGPAGDLVAVDWGPAFARDHAPSFPDAPSPEVFVNLGPLGLSYVLSAGGTGYFRRLEVEPHIAAGRLRLVPGMPRFSYPIYVVYATDLDETQIGPALDGLRQVASLRGKRTPATARKSPARTSSRTR
jgi:DNA-binding transcriptional LysR family regulator